MAFTSLLSQESDNHFQQLRAGEIRSFKVNKKTEEVIADTVNSLTSKQITNLFGIVKSFNIQVTESIKNQNPSIFETAPKKVDTILSEPKKVELSAVDGKVNATLAATIKTQSPSVFELAPKQIEGGLPVVSKAKYDLNTEIQKASLIRDIKKIKASVKSDGSVPGSTPLPSGGDVFLRFMALLRRMYTQTQTESNDLYKKVKERTDQIELLTNLVTQANLVKGDIDWSNDEKMKTMIDYAIDHCGLNWEKGKYVIPEAEKAIFRENCLARKDCMDRFSKLDQPEMQKYLHWLTEILGMLSNIGKLRHDTAMGIIANYKN